LQRVVNGLFGSAPSLQCSVDPLAHLRPDVVPDQGRISDWTEISCYRGPAGALR
jgi:hypothetical protein